MAMDLDLVMEHVEVALETGDSKKDQGTNFRMHLISANNEPLITTHWIGSGGTAGEWFGGDTTYYRGPNLPNWANLFDTWHASHSGDMTLRNLVGARLEIEIGSTPQTDHWELKAVVWAKVQGRAKIFQLSPDPGGCTGIASDGHKGWPHTLAVPLSLVV